VTGIDVGVVDRSGHSTIGWSLANLATFVTDGVAALIAYLLTRPGGPRVRPWLIGFPMWVASGLLSVIMLAAPLNLAAVPFGVTSPFRADDAVKLLEGVAALLDGLTSDQRDELLGLTSAMAAAEPDSARRAFIEQFPDGFGLLDAED
jgi:hypothetical protein